MKQTREQIKAELLKKAEVEIDRLLDWEDQAEKPNLTQIENTVLAARKAVGEEMLQALLSSQETQQPLDPPRCPKCQQIMQDKGKQARVIETRVGPIQVLRQYYYCPACQVGFFPSG
jgi:hypothetical protein